MVAAAAAAFIPLDALALGTGAFCGAFARYQCGQAATRYIAKDAKLQHLSGWHTAMINVSGSFVLGLVTSAPLVETKIVASVGGTPTTTQPSFGLTPRSKLLLGVGMCGSFTTFSTFSVDIVTWFMAGNTTKAVTYLVTNNVGGIGAAAIGMAVGKKLFGSCR